MKKIIYLLFFSLIPISAFSQIKYDTLNVEQIGEGALLYSIIAPSVPWTLQVVELDLTNGIYSLETVKANDKLSGYEKTSSMSSRKSEDGHNVIAAINGDFYGGGGIPTNLQVLKGEILRTPINREVFGYSDNSKMFINTTTYNGTVNINGVSNQINNVNGARSANSIIFYNHYFGSSTNTNDFGTEITLKAIDPWLVNGEVRSVVVSKSNNAGNSFLSDTNFVLSGHGTGADKLNAVSVGDTISVNHQITPGVNSIKEAIGGSRKFLNEGIVQGNWPERHPRSALGFNADTTKFYLVTVDGRQSTSSGMTLTELGDFMKNFGAHYALNLDGGGSTTLVVHDEIVNSPSDGSGERAVSNALMIVSNKSKIGTIERLHINPTINKIYRDKSFTYDVKGSDINFFPVDINNQDVSFTLSEGLDASISDDGVITAGSTKDTGYVFVEYNGLRDTSLVIIKGIKNLNIFPQSAVTDDENELIFYNESYDADNIKQTVYNSSIDWQVEDETIGSIEAGKFYGSKEGVTNVIATYDGVSDTSKVEVQIGTGELLINSFESMDGLTLGGTNIDLDKSEISISKENVNQGENSLRLDYELTYSGTPTIWAYIELDAPIFGIPDSIIIDGLSDGKKHLIDIAVEDDNAEEYSIRLLRYADNLDYEEYYLLMDNVTTTDPYSRFYYPITLKSIGIKIKTEQQVGEVYSGTLFLDNLRVSYPKDISVSTEDEVRIPSKISLKQNYPNPFNPSTEINFDLPESGLTSLKVYDILGREVSTLLNQNMTSGEHSIHFDASNLSSGVYIYKLSSKSSSVTKRMTLIK